MGDPCPKNSTGILGEGVKFCRFFSIVVSDYDDYVDIGVFTPFEFKILGYIALQHNYFC